MTESNAEDNSKVAPDQKGSEKRFKVVVSIKPDNPLNVVDSDDVKNMLCPPSFADDELATYEIISVTEIHPFNKECDCPACVDESVKIWQSIGHEGSPLCTCLHNPPCPSCQVSIDKYGCSCQKQKHKPCPDCSGTGEIMQTPDDSTPCPSCQGSGEDPAEEVDTGE